MSQTSQFILSDSTTDSLSSKYSRRSRDSYGRRSYTLIALGVVICLLLFVAGYLAGFFTPRENSSQQQTTNANFVGQTTTNQASTSSPSQFPRWIDQPCTIPDSSRCPATYKGTPPVITISFDGFRAEYLSRNISPAFEKFRKCGAHAAEMRPTHPAITFPNHYSLATGLHSESHGIVDNMFYDTDLKRQFNYKLNKDVTDPIWWGGQPVWVTATKQGKRSHAYFWVGTEAAIQGSYPDEYVSFNKSHTFEVRVDTVIDWIMRPKDTRPDITMLYFEEPDSAGHWYGTHGVGVENAIKYVDRTLERLMQGLYERNMLDCVNIVIVSDHGMKNSTCKDQIGLVPILQSSPESANITADDFYFNGGVQGRISLTSNSSTTIDRIYDGLRCSVPANSTDYPAYQLYKKEKLPRRYHYSTSARIEPIIINVLEGYQVWKNVNPNGTCLAGSHGFDNLYSSMAAVFMASGPSFKTQHTTEPFQNIELYNLLCDLAGLEPAPNNGTRGSLHSLLRQPPALQRVQYRRDPQSVFPTTEDEVRKRQARCTLDCQPSAAVMLENDLKLNLSMEIKEGLIKTFAPYGIPESPASADTVLLVNLQSVIGYSQTLRLPLWISSSLRENTMANPVGPEIPPFCTRSDVRLADSATVQCSDMTSWPSGVQPEYLIPLGLRNSVELLDEQLASSVVPMYTNFKNGIWTAFWRMLATWTQMGISLNVQSGPVFDGSAPYGIADVSPTVTSLPTGGNLAIPSHFFVVITSTNTSECEFGDCSRRTMAFMLPHDREPRSVCQDDRSFLLTNSARVQDVEMATGLKFFTGLPAYERIRLLTQLPTKLWDSSTRL